MWGFCGCNRRREREEVSPVRDMREFVEVRKACKKEEEHEVVMAETVEEVKPAMTESRSCGCNKRKRSNNNSMVSPAESSFCERQLEAARSGCVVNPFTAFNRCNR
ncbi:hypothetical protein [Bacillus sp. AFS041924]|uniref:hypothetical protein n=1 Tax=Bacillus sp. AFS041924 TaxID=2033503 RepID=UPI000BFC5537|nr:hypothetical protein [Bacillus sp. AFS041924]PGS47007.1 hypothetical protein COC46_20415 [Bacillus sp. AFS041924]